MSSEEHLQELIAVCQRASAGLERRKALNRLLTQVQQLPGLIKSSHPDYLEALNRTWEWFSKNLDDFQPRPPSIEVALVRWINGYLYWRIQDLYRGDRYSLSIDVLSYGDEDLNPLDVLADTGFNTPTLTGLDGYIQQLQQQDTQRIGCLLERAIEQDTSGKLRNCHPKAHPHCHCLYLSQRLRLKDPPDKLAEVARDLNVNYQALVAHWKRKCMPMLQEIALSLGYQPDFEP